MRSLRRLFLGGLFSLVLVTGLRGAENPPDPLRLVPQQADIVVQAPKPGNLIQAVTDLDLVKQLYALDAVREAYDSTNARRFYQLVAYFEKQLGMKWPEALERLGGGGAVLASKIGPNPPVLFILQGTDEELLARFLKVGLELVEHELARQEAKDRPRKGAYKGFATIRIGNDFHAAQAGSALILSNKEEALQRSLDLHLRGGKDAQALSSVSSKVALARKLMPAETLAWFWLDLDTIRKLPPAKEIFAQPRNDANLTVLFGGLLDVARRAPCVCGGIGRDGDGPFFTVRMPQGRDGMPEEIAIHAPLKDPKDPKAGGALPPLLQPKGVLFSSSNYHDLSKYWEHRTKLFNEKSVKQLEEFDNKSGPFLLGNRLSKLLSQLGSHQRIVVANQVKTPYQTQPAQRIPAFGVVVELREPEAFGKSIEGILRAGGFLASTQVKLKLTEEKHGDLAIVGFRFDEDAPLKGDPGNLRFNFSPCFVRVGNQLIASSTLELCHELVELVQEEGMVREVQGKRSQALGEVLAGRRKDTEELEKLIEKQIEDLNKTKDKQKRGEIIVQLHSLEETRMKLAQKIAKEAEDQDPKSIDKKMAGPNTTLARFYAAGGAEALKLVEDQLIAVTILNQALPPEEAKQQVGVLFDLIRRLGVLQFESDYGDKEFRFDVRLKLAK